MSKPKDTNTTQTAGQQSGADQQSGNAGQQSSGTEAGKENGKAPEDQNGTGETAEQKAVREAAEKQAREDEAERVRKAEEARAKEEGEQDRVAQANRDREAAAARARGVNRTTSKSEERARNAPKIETREHDVRENRTPREAQIARADEAMKRKQDDSTDGAKALASAHDDEEAIYAKLKDAPPTSGKARDENTPTEILADGTKVWGTPAA